MRSTDGSHDQETDGIGDHESRVDIAVLLLIPAYGFLQVRCQYAQGRTVDIQNGGGQEQQARINHLKLPFDLFDCSFMGIKDN